MYPIITEKGHQTYEAFGVKLEPINDINEVVSNSASRLIFDPFKSKALKRIIEQGYSDSIFINEKQYNPYTDFDFWLQATFEQLYQNAVRIRYNSVAPIYNSNRSYANFYDKILELFELFFDKGENIPSRIQLLYELNKYITTFQAIGFKLVRSTEKKTIIDNSKIIPCWLGSFSSLLKANTEALMVLTGNVSYVDNGEEVPIIVNEAERKLIYWKDVTPSRALNENFFSTYSSK